MKKWFLERSPLERKLKQSQHRWPQSILTATPLGPCASLLQTWEQSLKPSWLLPSQSWPRNQSQGQTTGFVTMFEHWYPYFNLMQSQKNLISANIALDSKTSPVQMGPCIYCAWYQHEGLAVQKTQKHKLPSCDGHSVSPVNLGQAVPTAVILCILHIHSELVCSLTAPLQPMN
jgi:hypothetical protein